jgi:hypothetical protein
MAGEKIKAERAESAELAEEEKKREENPRATPEKVHRAKFVCAEECCR